MKGLKFECPHCNQRIEAPPEILGMVVDCPSCNKQIQVPQPDPMASPPPLPPVISTPSPVPQSVRPQCLAVLTEKVCCPYSDQVALGDVLLYEDRLVFRVGNRDGNFSKAETGTDYYKLGQAAAFGLVGIAAYALSQTTKKPKISPNFQKLQKQFPDLYPGYRRTVAGRWGNRVGRVGDLILPRSEVSILEAEDGLILIHEDHRIAFVSKDGQAEHDALIRSWYSGELTHQDSVANYGLDLPANVRAPADLLAEVAEGRAMTKEECAYICSRTEYLKSLAFIFLWMCDMGMYRSALIRESIMSISLKMSDMEQKLLESFWKSAPEPFRQALREAVDQHTKENVKTPRVSFVLLSISAVAFLLGQIYVDDRPYTGLAVLVIVVSILVAFGSVFRVIRWFCRKDSKKSLKLMDSILCQPAISEH